jgi:hypothetical protein
VIEVTERGSEPPFARLEASQWQVTLPGVCRAEAEAAVGEFLAASRVEVERLTKNGMRRMDARSAVIRAVWEDGGRFDGWSEHFSFDRWARAADAALAGTPVDLDWYTTRERGYEEVLPWDHLDAGLDRDWLWQDWQDSVAAGDAVEVEDCRWTPCFECGVCPAMGTEIQTSPMGMPGQRTSLPVVAVTSGVPAPAAAVAVVGAQPAASAGN